MLSQNQIKDLLYLKNLIRLHPKTNFVLQPNPAKTSAYLVKLSPCEVIRGNQIPIRSYIEEFEEKHSSIQTIKLT